MKPWGKAAIGVLALLALMLAAAPTNAATIVANSDQWQNVYSVMVYAALTGQTSKFLVSDRHGPLLIKEISRTAPVEIYSAEEGAYFYGYGEFAKSEGYEATEVVTDDFNMELARLLPSNVTNFIIIDDAYGYNAIAVGSYAVLNHSYVLFAKRENLNEVRAYLEGRSVDHILIYGNIDREVFDALKEYNPDVINEGGDRFANNVELVKRYKASIDSRQIILTNGEFIENDLVNGAYPVLFIGNQEVPEQVKEYIKNSNIEVGVLIGNELVNTASIIRRQIGISTFVKFARGARDPQGPVAQIEGLDIFYMPIIDLNLKINRVRYNLITKQVEITFENRVEQGIYFKGTYTLRGSENSQTFGDITPIFIDGLDQKTITYDIDPVAGQQDLTLKAYVIYGESKNSLERVIDETFTVEQIEYLDETQISITKVVYDKSKKRFMVYLQNVGERDAYAKGEIVDFQTFDGLQTYTADKAVFIPAGKKKTSNIAISVVEEDLAANSKVLARAYYGENEDVLAKVVEGEFDLIIRTANIAMYVLLLIIILLLILIILAAKRRKKKKEEGSS